MRGRSYHWAMAVAVVLAAALRVLLNTYLTPAFDADTYKYLSGADSLWSGLGWPPLFRSLPVVGGVLHVMPGYALFLDAIWNVAGRVTLALPLMVQSLVALLAWLATSTVVAAWSSPTAGIFLFLLLAFSPPLVWLEHTLMPDGLAAPLLLLALWATVRGSAGNRPLLFALPGAVAAGLLMALNLLLRSSSQAFLPIPALLAWRRLRGWKSWCCWLAAYALATTVPLIPWLAYNHQVHGSYVLSASTGRNMYLSALWTNTIDRGARMQELGRRGSATLGSAYLISDLSFQELIRDGLSPIEADAAMRRQTLNAYLSSEPGATVRGRLAILAGMFVHNDGAGAWLAPLRETRQGYLDNPRYSLELLARLGQRFHYRYSRDLSVAMERDRVATPSRARELAGLWIKLCTLDGLVLLTASLLCLPLLGRRAGGNRSELYFLIAAPAALLATIAVFGTPLYRFQVELHPFLLATVVLGLWRLCKLGTARLAKLRSNAGNAVKSSDAD